MKRDYPELEGKVIEYEYAEGEITKVKVVGCNYDIGISFMHTDTSLGEYALCLNGDMSPVEVSPYWQRMKYRKVFIALAKAIKNGKFVASEMLDLINNIGLDRGNSPSASSCAFAA